MFRLFLDETPHSDSEATLSKADAHYLKDVRRLKAGETIHIITAKQEQWTVTVETIHSTHITFRCLEKIQLPASNSPDITLIQCLPKQDKFSDIIKKCCEISVRHFQPAISERVINKSKNDSHKLSRWETILKNAAQQSKQPKIPSIQSPQPLETLVKSSPPEALKLCFWEETPAEKTIHHIQNQLKANLPTPIIILIGPEGGLSQEEASQAKNNGFHLLSLGQHILRVENAAFYAISQLQYAAQQTT